VKPHIFREYDIRGIVGRDLGEREVDCLGSAVGTYYQGKGARRITLGRDCRLSSPEISDWLRKGLLESGMEVVDLGMVPTPLLYFSVRHLHADGGIQITGSHNPPEFNGFKICLGDLSVHGEEIQEIRRIAESGDFRRGTGRVEKADAEAPYLRYVMDSIRPGPMKRRVVVDGGNGMGGPLACRIYRAMGMEVHDLFCEPDGAFPNHHPDPTIPENLRSLIAEVKAVSADAGIAFDGDADRIGVVGPDGRVLWGDQLMILFSRDLLQRHPGCKIIGEVKCSQALYDDIEAHGGKAIMWKAGHSLIKSKMKEEGALLAGEMSGHVFFAERYFGYDDAIYAGARLLEILSRTEDGLDDFLDDIPRMVNTPEIRMDCPDEKKFEVVSRMVREFKKDYKVIDVDGARVLFDGGWGLIRASNTQPVLVLRFEAVDERRMEAIRKVFMDKLGRLL
jgi:phosphomannomutase/phosphoglucomutase